MEKTETKTNNKKLLIILGCGCLLLVGIIAGIIILASVTLIAVNPAKNFAAARDTQRKTDVTLILNAITQYTSERGNLLSDFGNLPECNAGGAEIGTGANKIDLGEILVPAYLIDIPTDPETGTDAATRYTICKSRQDEIRISAPGAEGTEPITVKR